MIVLVLQDLCSLICEGTDMMISLRCVVVIWSYALFLDNSDSPSIVEQ